MKEVNEKNKKCGFPELKMGIALNTGECVVGNIGLAEAREIRPKSPTRPTVAARFASRRYRTRSRATCAAFWRMKYLGSALFALRTHI